MGLISEFRTSLENPQTPLSYPAEWLLDIFNGGRTDSGIRVSEMTALQVTTFLVCVQIKAGAIGALDLRIFEKKILADGRVQRKIAHDHDLWDLLTEEPNSEMTSYTLRVTAQAHRMMWGNCFLEIQRDGGNRPIGIWPRNPSRTKPRRADRNFMIGDELIRAGELFYGTTEGTETVSPDPENPQGTGWQSERAIAAADMIHVPGLSLDGRVGQEPVQLARNAIGLALATEKFGGKFFGNGAVGMGVFEYPTLMAPEDFERTKRSLQEAYGGENNLRPYLLEAGMKYTPTSVNPTDAQSLETREFQCVEICRLCNVPPHMAGIIAKGNSKGNTEEIGQEFLTFSLRPDLRAFEQEIGRKVLPRATVGRSAGRKFGVFFDTWPLVVPSANDLRQFISAMIQFGVFAPNDALEKLGMNPLPGEASDSTYLPINIAPADKLYAEPALPGAEPVDEGDDQGDKKPSSKKKPKGVGGFQQQASRLYSRLFADAFGRVCARTGCELLPFQRAFMPIFLTMQEALDREASSWLSVELDEDDLSRSEFLAGYLKTMHHRYRSDGWSAAQPNEQREIVARELQRAVKAVAVDCYRTVATREAKQNSESELQEELNV
jgi:HK97 family phage portal protein